MKPSTEPDMKSEDRSLITLLIFVFVVGAILWWFAQLPFNYPDVDEYISGGKIPEDWTAGEWMQYKADHPNKARAHIVTLRNDAKAKHDNHWLRRWIKKLLGGNAQ